MKDEKLHYFWGSQKKSDFQGGGYQKPIHRWGLKGGLGQFADLKEAWEERGRLFLKGG